MPTPAEDVTVLLQAWRAGDADAGERLVGLVYQDLRRIAANHLKQERSGHTLQATALVNELFVQMFSGPAPNLENRAHFFAVAARQLRRILIDHARRRHSLKRGGLQVELSPREEAALATAPDHQLLEVDELLDELEALDSRAAQVIELKFFGGLTDSEAATVLNTSLSTIRRDWDFARSWLMMRLKQSPGDGRA